MQIDAKVATQTFYFVTAIRTSLDSASPIDDALKDYQSAVNSADALLSAHIQVSLLCSSTSR